MSSSPIELKGSNFTLSVLHLHSEDPNIIEQAVREKIEQAPAFFQNAPVVLNVSQLDPHADIKLLARVIKKAGLRIVGVSGTQNEQHRVAVTQANLPLLNEGKTSKAVSEAPTAEITEEQSSATTAVQQTKTRVINVPVRSGQRIYAPNSDLIVTSNVSAGAELIADGNIHIYGIMRGRVLAGAAGDTASQVFCTHLNAELVSIAGQYWLSDQIPSEYLGKAAKLSLVNNELSIDNLI